MRRPRTDTNAIEKRLAEGRGRGHGADYRPWIDVRDVPSSGLASRIPGRTTGRVHHVFSNIEADCFYLLDYHDQVIDVREQFPLLPIEETQQIAADLGVRHPTVPGAQTSVVMTTDFVATVLRPPSGAGDLAIACKPSSRLADPRTLEKLEIERRYWAARSVAWGVVTERDLPRSAVESVRWIVAVGGITGVIDPERVDALTNHLRARLAAAPDVALADVCAAEDDRIGLAPGSCLTLARYALATKRWFVDLSDGTTTVRPDRPLPQLRPSRSPALAGEHSIKGEPAHPLVNAPDNSGPRLIRPAPLPNSEAP